MVTILDRGRSFGLSADSHYNLTPFQQQSSHLLDHFVEQASDWKSLAAMTAGSLAYQAGKIGVFSAVPKLLGAVSHPLFTKTSAILFGLSCEVSAFRTVNHILNAPLRQAQGRLLSPDEGGGLFGKEWLSTFTDFVTLKGLGRLGAGQNVILSHLFQDTGMVAWHQLAYSLALSTKPQGNLIDQYLHAEIINLQMSAGLSVAHQLSGGKILALEKSLELQASSRSPLEKNNIAWNFAFASSHASRSFTRSAPLSKTPSIVLMSEPSNGGKDDGIPAAPPATTDVHAPPASTWIPGLSKAPSEAEPTLIRPVLVLPSSRDLADTVPPASPAPPPSALAGNNGKLEAGMVIGPEGRYVVMNLLGSGGFGDVYRVRDTLLDRLAVVKVPKEGRQAEHLLQRFEREIKIGANLDPRFSVTVYDKFELMPGLSVPVMEYVPGNDLANVIHQLPTQNLSTLHRFDYERRLSIFAEVCEAVEAAHRRGIMHRDLKPENIRLTEEGHVRIMDWGIAKSFAQAHSEEAADPESGTIESAPVLTQHGAWAGTPGYVAPEVMQNHPLENPRSPDIFALGVILYEWVTGQHPFASYKEGNVNEGNPAKVMEIDGQGRIRIGIIASLIGQNTAPAFSEVIAGDFPAYIQEIEAIARKAFSLEPSERYQSIQELREAVSLAYTQSEVTEIKRIREEMVLLEAKMHEAWSEFNPGKHLPRGRWEAMHQPLYRLRELRATWKQKGLDLIRYLEVTFKSEIPPEAKKMIAKLCWEILIDEGDLISVRERESLARLIRQYDVPRFENPPEYYKEALDGSVSIEFKINDEVTGTAAIPSITKVSVHKYFPDQDDAGNEILTFRTKELFRERLDHIPPNFKLSTGYYVFEINHPGYAPLRIPIHLSPEELRLCLKEGKAFQVKAELIDIKKIPSSMVVVQGREAWRGIDYYQEPNPLNQQSVPQRKISFSTFAMSRYPVTINEYQQFIQSLLHIINEEIRSKNYREAGRLLAKVRKYIPRAQPMIQEREELLRDPNPTDLGKAFEGVRYNWRVVAEGEGKKLQFKLIDPTSHRTPDDEPILPEQPMHSIPLSAIEAYIDWRNKKEGRSPEMGLYSLPDRDELELVARNTFHWTYPWGYFFHPYYASTRLIHEDLDGGSFARPVGTHAAGREFYRDVSAFGVFELLGNTREVTRTVAEETPLCVFFFGGSTRTPFGVYFNPSAMSFGLAESVLTYNFSFRLVLRRPVRPPSP